MLSIEDNWFGYKTDRSLSLNEMNNFKKAYHLWREFLEVRKRFDVYHFNFGRSMMHYPRKMMPQLDLPFYPKESKLFVTYQGCDARQKYPTMARTKFAACHQSGCYSGQCNSGQMDEDRRTSIDKMSKYVDHMWALNPDLLYFLPKEKSSFLPYAITPIETPEFKRAADQPFTIVHAPTDQHYKGSKFIVDAIEKLKTKYPGKIQFNLIQNLNNQDAMAEYLKADLIVDQILVGWYGAFAVECMYMGKPVIARIAEEDLHFIPSEMAKDLSQTVINANPETIESVIEELIQDPSRLARIGRNSVDYAHRWHLPETVAQITREKYESH